MQESDWTLIPPPPRCFGREREINDLVDLLLAENPQQIPILGSPGIGKTTISLATLHHPRVIERYGGRRCFIRCDGIKTCEGLVAQVGLALGLQLSPRTESKTPVAEVAGPSVRQFSPRTESEALVAEVGMPSTLKLAQESKQRCSQRLAPAVLSLLSIMRKRHGRLIRYPSKNFLARSQEYPLLPSSYLCEETNARR